MKYFEKCFWWVQRKFNKKSFQSWLTMYKKVLHSLTFLYVHQVTQQQLSLMKKICFFKRKSMSFIEIIFKKKFREIDFLTSFFRMYQPLFKNDIFFSDQTYNIIRNVKCIVVCNNIITDIFMKELLFYFFIFR